MAQAQLDFEFVRQEIELVKTAIDSNDFEVAWQKLDGLFLLHLENWSAEFATEIASLKQKALQKIISRMRHEQ